MLGVWSEMNLKDHHLILFLLGTAAEWQGGRAQTPMLFEQIQMGRCCPDAVPWLWRWVGECCPIPPASFRGFIAGVAEMLFYL